MNRRKFTALTGAAAAWPLMARAQQGRLPVVGFLSAATPEDNSGELAAFLRALADQGFVEGRNVAIERRWARGDAAALAAMAAEFARLPVAIIASTGGNPATFAARAATTTIPIVFTMGDDPVALGIVESLNRPGGHITGSSFHSYSMGPKVMELIKDIMPGVTSIAMIANLADPSGAREIPEQQAAARQLGLQLEIYPASNEAELDASLSRALALKPNAITVGFSLFLTRMRRRVIEQATRQNIPVFGTLTLFARDGALASYSAVRADAYRKAGDYVGRILKGARPADLPVQLPTKFELMINLKTAKAIGLHVSETILTRADEVIE